MNTLTLALLEQIACGAPAKEPKKTPEGVFCVNDVVRAAGFEITISQPQKMTLLKKLGVTPIRVAGTKRVRMYFDPNAVKVAIQQWRALQKKKTSEAARHKRSRAS
jgi:hypothetical protein